MNTHTGHSGVCLFTESDGVTTIRLWTDPDEKLTPLEHQIKTA